MNKRCKSKVATVSDCFPCEQWLVKQKIHVYTVFINKPKRFYTLPTNSPHNVTHRQRRQLFYHLFCVETVSSQVP